MFPVHKYTVHANTKWKSEQFCHLSHKWECVRSSSFKSCSGGLYAPIMESCSSRSHSPLSLSSTAPQAPSRTPRRALGGEGEARGASPPEAPLSRQQLGALSEPLQLLLPPKAWLGLERPGKARGVLAAPSSYRGELLRTQKPRPGTGSSGA